jgi:hypothetical protein
MKPADNANDIEHRIAEAVRRVCIQAAKQGYGEAAASGLCAEGAFEAAVGAMQMLDLNQVILLEKQP